MKRLLLLSFILISIVSFGAKKYIATTGNDGTGNGTSGLPWKTLYKACTSTSSGDTIIVAAGTYIETLTCPLPVGVSVQGAGITSILKSTNTAEFSSLLYLYSGSEGSNGNQSISFVKFEGINGTDTTGTAILTFARSNVNIHDCTFVNFKFHAIITYGKINGADGPPSTYAIGNLIYNNQITNCSDYQYGGGYGSISISGQQDMLIHDNTIDARNRRMYHNGVCIKTTQNRGYTKGLKIYNNNLLTDYVYPVISGYGWNFAIEVWNNQGLEIYNNYIQGMIDLGGDYNSKGSYSYASYVHNNTIRYPSLPTVTTVGIIIEANSTNKDVYISKNRIANFNTAITFYPLNGNKYSNINIYYNIIDSVGVARTGYNSTVAITEYNNEVSPTYSIDSVYIYNNLIKAVDYTGAYQSEAVYIQCKAGATFNNWYVRNNIIMGFDWAPFWEDVAGTITQLNWENNLCYNNGNSNEPLFDRITPGTLVNQNNIKGIDPYFVSSTDYNLHFGSPAIDKGLNVGLTSDYINHSIVGLPDIGCYEFIPIGNTKKSLRYNHKTIKYRGKLIVY